MASSFAWVSVLVKRGMKVVKERTILKCNWSDTFGELLPKLNEEFAVATVAKIVISNSEKFVDPCHVVPLDSPIQLCDEFQCKYVCFHLDCEPASSSQSRDVFNVLMANSQEVVLPQPLHAPEGRELKADQRLYNDLIGMKLH